MSQCPFTLGYRPTQFKETPTAVRGLKLLVFWFDNSLYTSLYLRVTLNAERLVLQKKRNRVIWVWYICVITIVQLITSVMNRHDYNKCCHGSKNSSNLRREIHAKHPRKNDKPTRSNYIIIIFERDWMFYGLSLNGVVAIWKYAKNGRFWPQATKWFQ